jgi:hypothetical protein
MAKKQTSQRAGKKVTAASLKAIAKAAALNSANTLQLSKKDASHVAMLRALRTNWNDPRNQTINMKFLKHFRVLCKAALLDVSNDDIAERLEADGVVGQLLGRLNEYWDDVFATVETWAAEKDESKGFARTVAEPALTERQKLAMELGLAVLAEDKEKVSAIQKQMNELAE